LGTKDEFKASVNRHLDDETELYEDEELEFFIRKGGEREPFVFVCKNGPGCKNHDWKLVSPLHLIKQKRTHLCQSPAQARHATP